MTTDFDFRDLFVFDLANNHQGDMEHARNIIRGVGRVVRENGVRGALKFQFRDLPEFIHVAHREESSNKHAGRFLSTALSLEQYAELADLVREEGMVTMSTPFDEASVRVIEEMDLDVAKVASCSATDWPLLERISEANMPVLFSTGGLDWKEIDDLVSFFSHRMVHFAIMHCVAVYPTPSQDLQLEQVRQLSERYPNPVIGFSTHEDPDALVPVVAAVAKGAQMLERHVGLPTDEYPINRYSSTPEQLDRWIKAALEAKVVCGGQTRPPPLEVETQALLSLKRGVYARESIEAGQEISDEMVYFALPCEQGQISSGEWGGGIVQKAIRSGTEVVPDGPLMLENLELPQDPEKQVLITAIHTMKGMLNEARIALPADFETEFSHHYGIERFPEVGATLITVVNRSYCKKILLQIPGQRHPSHYHKKKEETFHVLHGVLEMEIDGRRRTLYPGDKILVQQGVWHRFWTDAGVIFEELSTQHVANDSFYEDKEVNHMPLERRKTWVNHWGRYQL